MLELKDRIRIQELEKEVESLKLRNAALERALSKIATAILPVIGGVKLWRERNWATTSRRRSTMIM